MSREQPQPIMRKALDDAAFISGLKARFGLA